MEYDDRFDAARPNDIDDSNNIDLKKMDKRYLKITKNISVGQNRFKTVKIEMYGSGDVGSTIRDAESGHYYMGNIVGSKSEDAFFKTSYTLTQNREPLMLYYLTPEHYERHLYVTLDTSIKQKWYNRMNSNFREKEKE